jgi:hypothetical protein
MAFQACGKLDIFSSINEYYFPSFCPNAGLAVKIFHSWAMTF